MRLRRTARPFLRAGWGISSNVCHQCRGYHYSPARYCPDVWDTVNIWHSLYKQLVLLQAIKKLNLIAAAFNPHSTGQFDWWVCPSLPKVTLTLWKMSSFLPKIELKSTFDHGNDFLFSRTWDLWLLQCLMQNRPATSPICSEHFYVIQERIKKQILVFLPSDPWRMIHFKTKWLNQATAWTFPLEGFWMYSYFHLCQPELKNQIPSLLNPLSASFRTSGRLFRDVTCRAQTRWRVCSGGCYRHRSAGSVSSSLCSGV